MRKLVTNCPNCGGVLNTDGRCPYCCTHVRYANEIDIQTNNLWGNQVEILINVQHGDTTVLYPLVGHFESMTVSHEPYGVPEVELNFRGFMIDIDSMNNN